jgi:hypothetical protein
MRLLCNRAKKFLCLTVLICALPVLSVGKTSGELYLSLSLIRGEHSKDSNSRTTNITIRKNKIVYEETFSGYRSSSRQPVNKEFQISARDIEKLKRIIRANGLLKAGSVDYPKEGRGYTYFSIAIKLKLDGTESWVNLSGPANATKIKNEQPYKNSAALVKEVYRIINKLDQDIDYEEMVD